MKTVGVISFSDDLNNYGAILQLYALQQKIKDMGFRVEVIDYCNKTRGGGALPPLKRARFYLWHSLIKKMLVGTKRGKKTRSFIKKHVQFSIGKYSSWSQIHESPPRYDFYIVGSDQVWNPIINNFDSTYFLSFVNGMEKKISYAASFGISALPEKYREQYASWLQKIDLISVREIEGQEIVKELTGLDSEIVLDPTMLLDKEQWAKVGNGNRVKSPYILTYHMPGDKEVNSCVKKMAEKISKINRLPVISLGKKEYEVLNPNDNGMYSAGPAEFVSLFQNASHVVTNSFHGTAFSVIMQKPFHVVLNNKLPLEKKLGSRITSLINKVGLNDRIVYSDEQFDNKLKLPEINYGRVDVILKAEREKSQAYLTQALK